MDPCFIHGYKSTQKVGFIAVNIAKHSIETSSRRCFCSIVSKRGTHLAHSYFMSKFLINMRCTTLFEMPRSCDLTPLDFFLWGHVKDKVYADAPQSIQELKEKIRAVIDKIEPQMCENVMENFIKRAWSCKRSRGGHMNDIVFHY